jgi:hypothetical protein
MANTEGVSRVRVLIVGWPSFLHGEATAGDVLSMRRVASALLDVGLAADTAWSPVFRAGGPDLGRIDPAAYTHLVFVCGPAHGEQVRGLHARFASCRRIAVGVSVIDENDDAVTGFDRILARDGPTGPPAADLSADAATVHTPVVGVVLAPGQPEYGDQRRHDDVHRSLTDWLAAQDCARIELDTRLDRRDWRRCGTADQFVSIVSRLDAVVTTRLHGLVLALANGVPALAVDPVAGGGKVRAQAEAWQWPAIVSAEEITDPQRCDPALNLWWAWCRSARRSPSPSPRGSSLTGELLRELGIAESVL